MKTLNVEKFASATYPLRLKNPVEVEDQALPVPGQAVVVRALTENPKYADVELTSGERVRICKGDVIAGILGSRQALRGFVGYSPYRVATGDRLHVLNLGGVIGRYVSGHPDVGFPVEAEVLGISPRNLREVALPSVPVLPQARPVILVAGSCMNVGKTETIVELIRGLTGRGLKVGAAKITGIACLKDTILMEKAGAVRTYSFLDCGVASTVDVDDISSVAKSVIARLHDVDVVVLELGDGMLGFYRVERFFEDRGLMAHVDAVIFCAADLTAAWGGKEYLDRRGVGVTVFSGPVTDTEAGVTYLERTLGVRAANAHTQLDKLLDLLTPVLT